MIDGICDVREADARDLTAIVEGNLAMAHETEDLRLDRATLTEGVRAVLEKRVPGRYFVLEREDGAVIAQLMITYEWSDWRNGQVWWIQSVYVPPSEREKGCYRALYEAVERIARSEGARGIRLYVETKNARAQAVYAALGMDGGHYKVFEKMLA
jgi:GNAT superfamily N-acetyltransferase